MNVDIQFKNNVLNKNLNRKTGKLKIMIITEIRDVYEIL